MRIYSPTPVLGYGYNASSLARALDWEPDLIAVDGGSTDPGPYYLGSGKSFTDELLVKNDLRPLLLAARARSIPIVVGTAGGAGGAPHVAITRQIVEELAREEGLTFTLTLIHAEQDQSRLEHMADEGKVRPLYPMETPPLEAIQESSRVVGLMGVEPYLRAFEEGAEVIIAGRSDDAAVFASYAIHKGISPASAWLAGKFLECGGACAVPKHGTGFDGLLATVEDDHVMLEPVHQDVKCTVQSVSTFLLHENESPIEHKEPSGTLDLSELKLEQVSDRAVRLVGARFRSSPEKSVRLEGAGFVGHRTIVVGWTRDPVLIPQIDDYLDVARERVQSAVRGMPLDSREYQLMFRVIGKDAVMGPREPVKDVQAHELGIIADAVAPTPGEAATLAAAARVAIKNASYPGKLCDEGCITFPYSPSEIEVGSVYRFSMWHTVEPADMEAMFPIEHVDVGSLDDLGSRSEGQLVSG